MKQEPQVTLELALQHGLTEAEYRKVESILGRTPSYTELGIYSVMWSEHCSYKNSIAQLKTLPRSGGRLLVGAGEENAGLVDIGDGMAVAFKIESHNHPSAVEPYQGAATGVGGIMRDIFTMGARPIAGLNSLRFGSLDHTRTRFLFKGVVKGIGDYGNSFGVPTVAGEVYFDPCYQTNPLVNAMSVGIVKHHQVASAVAKGKGNTVMIVGASTGRDGIHGATFASEEISEKSEAKRPSVQVGDPFTEKLLLEATLEVIHGEYLVGIQDMGAAGITCSTMEMSAKGNAGMVIDLDKVPVRESGMSAYEIMLSESQERMLLVSKPGMEEKIKEVFAKWDLHCVAIGTVTDDGIVKIYHHGELKAEVPAETLVLGGGAPVYIRETAEPQYLKEVRSIDINSIPEPSDYEAVIMALLKSPNIAGKRWVYEQYDSMVRTNTVSYGGCDAAIVKIKGTTKYLSMKTDCNGRYVYLNPRKGAMIAVAESARNVVCSGGTPLAITNCLNFGNPYKPEMYWQFAEAVAGVGEACRVLETPVTGGNVSFYNESPTAAVYPTPVIGMVGLIEDRAHITPSAFQDAGDAILLLGEQRGDLNGSEYLSAIHGVCGADAPWFDLAFEKRLQACLLELIHAGRVKSAHDAADGGLIVTLIESAICSGATRGFTVRLKSGLRMDRALFGEEQSRVVISADPSSLEEIAEICRRHGVPQSVLGTVTGTAQGVVEECVSIDLDAARAVIENEIGRRMDEAVMSAE
ncbi:MAG: phosphoribosylformylglycinamidine synthase subunit PurL [Acidobacteriota bacterium]